MGYYGHHQVKEGYTQKGQMLAGAYSYFGDSQLLKFQLFFPKSSHSIFVHRFCPDMNYIYNMAVGSGVTEDIRDNKHSRYRTFFTIGIQNNIFITDSILINFEYDFVYGRHFLFKDNSDIVNNRFSLNIKYNL